MKKSTSVTIATLATLLASQQSHRTRLEHDGERDSRSGRLQYDHAAHPAVSFSRGTAVLNGTNTANGTIQVICMEGRTIDRRPPATLPTGDNQQNP